VTGQTHVAGGALFTAAGLGAAIAAGWMHAPAWALAIGIAWGAIAGDLPDIDHPKARVSRSGVAFSLAGRLLGLPTRIVGLFIRGLRVTHRGPTHSLAFMALWATIAAPLYLASAGGLLVVLAWMIDNVGAVSHTGAHLTPQPAMRFLLAHLPIVYPYAAVCTALGYLSHLVLDSLTGPIPWGWPFAHRRIALTPAPLRIRTDSSLETGVVRPALTVAATLAFLEVAGIPFGAMSASGSRQTRAGCGSLGPPFLPTAHGASSSYSTSVCARVDRAIEATSAGTREPGTTLCFGGGSLAPPFALAAGVWHHPLLPARESSTTLSRALPSVALPMLSES
jgi:membrane-bound metal-dependent hydrolase YbcI (DUF457 family)